MNSAPEQGEVAPAASDAAPIEAVNVASRPTPIVPAPSVTIHPSPKDAWAPGKRASADTAAIEGASASPITGAAVAQPVVARAPRMPRPIDVDDPEVIRPVAAPPASEILPTASALKASPGYFDLSGLEPGGYEEEESADPVRLLGESAATAALFDAAGAKTPATGIPVVPISDDLPFEVEEQFVPKFDPSASGRGWAKRGKNAAQPAPDAPVEEAPTGEASGDEPPSAGPEPTPPAPEPSAPAAKAPSPKPSSSGPRPQRRGLGPPVVKDFSTPQPRVTANGLPSGGLAGGGAGATALAASATPAASIGAGAAAAGGVAIAARQALDTLAPLPKAPASFTTWSEIVDELPDRSGPSTLEEKSVSEFPTSSLPPVTPASTDIVTPATPPGPPAAPELQVEGGSRGKKWLWIALGVVAAAGIGVAVYFLFLKPEPIILPAPVVTEEPPTPTIDAVDITHDNALLAAMPREVSTYALTGYEIRDLADEPDVPARASDHVVVTYGESSGDAHFTVNAYQFYSEEGTATAYALWSEGATDRHDVVADGKVVGERALVGPSEDRIVVWTNGTVVFILQGPADEVEQFYAYFGL